MHTRIEEQILNGESTLGLSLRTMYKYYQKQPKHWKTLMYKFITPEGETIYTKNYLKVCEEYGLNKLYMLLVFFKKQKQHQGWKGCKIPYPSLKEARAAEKTDKKPLNYYCDKIFKMDTTGYPQSTGTTK